MSSRSTKYGSSSGRSDPFKNTTSNSMSQKLKEPKKKRAGADSQKEEAHTSAHIHVPTRHAPQKRRTQNRNSQRAYRERRERRLTELECQVQQAEVLNQTLTSAYQRLRCEIARLEAEKAQEQAAREGVSAPSGFLHAADPAPAYYDANVSPFFVAGYGQGGAVWEESRWAQQAWQGGQDYDYHA